MSSTKGSKTSADAGANGFGGKKPLRGAARGASLPARAPRGGGASGYEPLDGVLGMGSRLSSGALTFAVALAILLHGGAAAAAGTAMMFADIFDWANAVKATVSSKLNVTYEIETVKEPEPPPPEPVKEEPKEEPKPETPPPPKAPTDEPPPPPAAAQASQVLTQEPAKDEPLDLTGNTITTGTGNQFAGGVTQAGGTSKTAVYNAAAVATGVPGGTGTAPSPATTPKVDRSRGAAIVNKGNLERCPFPPEADSDQIDEALVGIEVKVTTDGRPENVSVWLDPGHGFGREAKKCALREKYEPALNVDGAAIPGTYRVRFRFSR